MQKSLGLLIMVNVSGITYSTTPSHSANLLSTSSTSKKQLSAANYSTLPAGQKILKTGRHMAVVKKEIIRGSCWDYIHAVYNRSGYPQKKRRYVLKGKKNKGPYAKPTQIQPGDWLYYINHSYHGVEHSGIFVRWVDKQKRLGITLSYAGESKKKPGRYRQYDLSNVYTIIRPKN